MIGLALVPVVASAGALGVSATAPFAGAALAFTLLGEPFGAAHAGALLLFAWAAPALLWSQHSRVHVHEPLEHVHSHRHDDGHHFHEHPGLDPAKRHSHAHERLVHAHPHWPDIHHRHGHESGVEG